MADALSTVNGISSGIQWQTMVDQIIAIESKRTVSPLQTRQSTLSSAASAWTDFQAVVGRFRDAALAVRDASTFGALTASSAKSASTGRDIVAVTADATASPGSYRVEVQQLASAQKIGGIVVSSATAALGTTGSFAVNGRTVSVEATDTLTTLRDKVNTLNTGTSATGVTASILRGTTGARLVFSADQTGAAGIELVDDTSGTLTTLGLTDATVRANITAGGATQSNRVSSSTAAFASLFGIPLPSPSSIEVGGQTITVDFSIDSLATVAARINAASGLADAAAVVTETVGARTYSRLQTRLAVEANPADAANSARTLAVLGFTTAGRGSITQVVKSANTFAIAGGANANGATLLSDLQVGGQGLGVGAGDVLTISGTRGDGTAVTRTLTVGAGSTMQDLVDSANNASGGFAAGSRTATLSLSGGQLVLTDGTSGDSQLGISLTVAKASGGTISLGGFSAGNGGTVGLNRQISAGSDSRFVVDGQSVARNTNAVTDVVSGVTFNLLAAEAGTTVGVSVARDTNATLVRMQTFATTYNEVRAWADNNTATGKRLENNSAVRSMVASLSSSLLTQVTGLSGTYTLASMVGVSRDKYGVLSVNADTFTAALAANFEDVKKLFSTAGVPTDSEVSFISSTDVTAATATPYAVVISQAATAARVTGSVFATYATAGTPDTMSITDASTGRAGAVTLTNGDSIDKVIANLNSLFATQKMNLLATNAGGAVRISASDYGSTSGFTVGYTAGTADGTAQLGIAAASVAGLDVAGTIGGVAATGKGRLLIGGSGSAADGMQLLYSGTTARAAGSVAYSIGVGGILYSVASKIARDLDGQAATMSTNASNQADALSARITAAQDRLAMRKATLTAQFIAMESAMSKAQSVGTSLTSQINGLFNYNKSA